ncbi:alkanesulfonate transporter subunit; ATP-binding component of ABC superfamily [Frankia canadensis]|uniref:Alkanesulfonate transporter subunit ATP-binding component of ABC superfamily n=1 Tax=Frankia canadensis TaxID=1836972 RepID=A0A2I2KRZ8_9ACTN|nr:ABC transporter ATP-binding protein [Frankia canadensis]SNQ48447.1 alkanesulfonate transporter subunit; ATP-binding component of ABC superfamily [Frankia canadensis]SOU55737.1 alkanesulfonate transporter subunit; ATP-binding component of ABC superfamily [Frankia canadensis]
MATRLRRNLTTASVAGASEAGTSVSRTSVSGTSVSGTSDASGGGTAVADRFGDAAVRVRGLRRAFGDQVVLDGLDLTVAPGEFVALLGRSGSGKSTLLRVLGGFDHEVDGQVLAARSRSVVFQEARLLPWRRLLPNVTLGLTGRDAGERGRAALAEVGLSGRERSWPVTLSGGEAQRVALARALVREPELLMLDEPFGALDALTRIRMHALLQRLCRRHRPAVLFVTHDVDEAILLADRVLVLTAGRFSLDVAVDVASPRRRTDPAFDRLRTLLLAELGVDDLPESTH